jgi:small GTP-binding protein
VFTLKIVCFGDSGVGKTSLLYCYDTSRSLVDMQALDVQGHLPTIGVQFHPCSLMIRGYHIKLMLWDTAGQERFRSIGLSYVRGAHGIVLVYDVTKPESCTHVLEWLAQVQDAMRSDNDPLVLVIGNKVDLARRVLQAEAKQLFERLNFLYMETSAQTGLNVRDAIDQLAVALFSRFARNKQEPSPPSPLNPNAPIKPHDPSLSTTRIVVPHRDPIPSSFPMNLQLTSMEVRTAPTAEFDVRLMPPPPTDIDVERMKRQLNPPSAAVKLSHRPAHPSAYARDQETIDRPGDCLC